MPKAGIGYAYRGGPGAAMYQYTRKGPQRGGISPTRAPAPAPAGGASSATAVTGGSDIMGLYASALERLSGGGLSLKASLADIEAGKKEAIGRGQQSMVSSGLAGTTVMGGVPVAAEKVAGRARLAARGEAEGKYLTTLASFAAFAQRAQQAAADRASAMQRLQMQIGSQERLATMGGPAPVSQSEVGGPSYTTGLSPDIERGPVGSGYYGNYSQNFPSIYGGAEEEVPNWMG